MRKPCMNLFDKTVQSVLENNTQLTTLRPVVEKEILHHDILWELNDAGLLKKLTFIGGTCLRDCYGSQRLSEDLDFSSSFDFNKEDLANFPSELKKNLLKKYGFEVEVSEPKQETGNTNTWKIKILTRPEQKYLPAQRINLDIVLLPSYQWHATMLKNYYGLESGASGLILQAESLTEILVDKLIAFANRPNRVKNRDLWDIFWLSRQNVVLDKDLLLKKLSDRKITFEDFATKYGNRLNEIQGGQEAFLSEMKRFLAPSAFDDIFTSPLWWEQLLNLLKSYNSH